MSGIQFLFAILVAVFVITVPVDSATAQGVGSSRGLPSSFGGVHTIKGRVFFPDAARPAERKLKVRLEGANTFGSLTAVTDDDGQFTFNRVEAGSYTVVVEGDKEYETAREPVNIYREASPGARIIDVPIYLKLKGESTLAAAPKPALDLYKKAQDSARSGDGKKAIEHFKAAVGIYPNFPEAFNELGVEYLKLGQINEAVEALATAVKLGPVNFQARLNYGIALLNQKKFPESEQQLRQALAKIPTAPTAHMYLGMALMNQKKLDEAQKELETAISSNSSEVGVAHKYLGGIYWGKRDYKRAADELELYLKLVPKAADAERTQAAIKELRAKQ